MAKRGELTESIKTKMECFFDRETNITELHLIPYIQYVMVNERQIDPIKINREEREILSMWRNAGYLIGGAGDSMLITKEFWQFMCDILLEAYVDYDNN